MIKKMIFIVILCLLVCTTACSDEMNEQTAEPEQTCVPIEIPSLVISPAPTTSFTPVVTQKSKDDLKKVELAEGFYYTELSDAVKSRITGKSYPKDDCIISYEDLRYIKLLHYDFNGEIKEGELIVNAKLADEVTNIFYRLFLEKYPLESVRLIDDFGGDDNLSMAANNTSAFNYRLVSGSNSLSLHSFGMAIDINPKLNPFVDDDKVSPENGAEYKDRSLDFPGKIDKNDLCYKLFTEYGWTWGGNWRSYKDYQHFYKDIQ